LFQLIWIFWKCQIVQKNIPQSFANSEINARKELIEPNRDKLKVLH
jgi:hypothetical protein